MNILLLLLSFPSFFLTMGVSSSKTFGPEAKKVLGREVFISASSQKELATFAAGCFWGIELAFQRVPGVIKTEVGYTQGISNNPTYEEVCSGTKYFHHNLFYYTMNISILGSSGHAEAVQVTYDSTAIKFEDLLTVFWDIHDPTTKNRQGNDVGTQYRSGIYYHTEAQRIASLSSKDREQQKLDSPIVTEILPAKKWYPAENYHQQYLQKGGQCAQKGDTSAIRCYG